VGRSTFLGGGPCTGVLNGTLHPQERCVTNGWIRFLHLPYLHGSRSAEGDQCRSDQLGNCFKPSPLRSGDYHQVLARLETQSYYGGLGLRPRAGSVGRDESFLPYKKDIKHPIGGKH
jgi:hypothetical protein